MTISLPTTEDRRTVVIEVETEVEAAAAAVVVEAAAVATETLVIVETLISVILEVAIGAEVLRRMEGTSAIRRVNSAAVVAAAAVVTSSALPVPEEMTVGRNSRLEMIAGRITGTTAEWEALEAAADGMATGREAAAVAKVDEMMSIGPYQQHGMSDRSWNCSVLAILVSTLANMRISRLMPPVTTYHHTSHP